MAQITIIAAFIAGILSFLSPCVLPLIPAFLGYLAGVSVSKAETHRTAFFLNSMFYVLGFSTVFSVLGVLLNTVLVHVSGVVQTWLARIGGIIIILFGLHLLNVLPLEFLERQRSFHLKPSSSFPFVRSFLFGAAFAVGWTPCVGPILGSVLSLSISQPGSSFLLLAAYSLGLGIPFLILGFLGSKAYRLVTTMSAYLKYYNIVVGIILILLGILVFTQTLSLLANFSLLNRFLLR